MYYTVAQTIVNVKNIQARKIETINKHEKILTKILAKIYNIVIEKFSKSKIKIVGIDSRLGNDMNKLEDLQDRNFDKYSTNCTVLHDYTNGKTKTNTLIVEVSPEIYKQIKDNNYRVFIGHQCCRAYDIFNVKPCYKCGRFGHNGSK